MSEIEYVEEIPLRDHCRNKNCMNFSRKYDLAGIWCQEECFIESESGEPRPTRKEFLEMKIKQNWDMEQEEYQECLELGLIQG
jgi:hypothetical protein